MTREEYIGIFGPYLLYMQAQIDAPSHRVYYHVLRDVPASVFSLAIERLMCAPRKQKSVPTAGEILAMCEVEEVSE